MPDGHLTALKGQNEKEDGQHNQHDRAAGGKIEIKGGENARDDGKDGNDFRADNRLGETFLQLQGGRDRYHDEGGNQQNSDNRNGQGDSQGGQDDEDGIDGSDGDAAGFGGLFVKADIEKFFVKSRQDGQDNDGQGGYDIDVAHRNRHNAAEQVIEQIGVESPVQVQKDDGQGQAAGKEKRQGRFAVGLFGSPQALNAQGSQDGDAEGGNERADAEKQAEGNARQRHVGKRVGNEGIAPEHQENADEGGDDGHDDPRLQSPRHEAVLENIDKHWVMVIQL